MTVLCRDVARQLSIVVCRPEAPVVAMQRQGSDSAMGVVLDDFSRQLGEAVEVHPVLCFECRASSCALSVVCNA